MRVGALKRSYAIAAVAAVLALFARTAAFSYIGLDDAAYTFRNPFVAGGFSLANVVESFANLRHGGIWMPATYISYMLDASICRYAGMPLIGWMHLVNVLLHILNFLLLCRFLFVTLDDGKCSAPLLLAALFWAIHPLRAEPVAWIAARKELLWTFFALLGLLCRLDLRKWRWTYLFCLLACLSKPTAMCFPFLVCLVDWLSRREHDAKADGKPFEQFVKLRYLPLFIMAAATAAIAAYSQTHVAGQGVIPLYVTTFGHRVINALSAFGFYLRATLLPFGLHVDCRAVPGLWPLGAVLDLGALALFAVSVVWSCLLAGKASSAKVKVLFALGWFIVSLVPTSGLLGDFGMEAHADRFSYLPSMGFSFLVAAFFLRARSVAWRYVAGVLVVAFAVLTFRQLGFWIDDSVAHERALACDSLHPRAMVHVADARCSRRRDFDGGISLYRKALSLSDTVPPGGLDDADVKSRLAYALASRGRYEDFQEVKRLGADVLGDFRIDRRGMMLDALGTAFMCDGDFKRAALLFKASIEAPNRFWPKASTLRKLEECKRR